ncbi:MAG: biopolymer transporter ExbD [Planctomycetes bacterium]|nr:biopolymer transporter ExbD [Planctomycetota bacterium]
MRRATPPSPPGQTARPAPAHELGPPDADDVAAVQTPFLDVLLLTVCLLITRASNTMPAHAVEIDPPRVAGEGAEPVRAERPVVVGVAADGRVTIDDEPTTLDELPGRLARLEEPEALVRVDGALPTTATLDVVARIRPLVQSVQVQVVPRPAANAPR